MTSPDDMLVGQPTTGDFPDPSYELLWLPLDDEQWAALKAGNVARLDIPVNPDQGIDKPLVVLIRPPKGE